MWSSASTTAIWTQFASDVGVQLAVIIAAIVAVVAGLIVIGMGISKTKKHVTGKKF